MKKISLLTIFFLILSCVGKDKSAQIKIESDLFHESMQNLTDIIVHDIFSPPVASRIYAYASIAAYESFALQDSNYLSLGGQLSEFKGIDHLEIPMNINYSIVGLHAFNVVGKALIFSEDKMEDFQHKQDSVLIKHYKISKSVLKRSQAFGDQIAKEILNWADNDMYKQTRTYPKYSVTDKPGRWQPTPPDYMDGIEPHWREIRTLVLDSAQMFIPPPPPPFSMDKNSVFYKETMKVYEAVNNVSEEEQEIASFWDCNPYVSHHQGHVMFATKKITPGGHWIGIASIAAKKVDADMMKTAEGYMLCSIALFDAFISCWDEKYRSNLIRPETVINQHIDENWAPILQTPPFPEHTSGHSVVSGAAAVALTSVFGENFEYIDDVEVKYGLPERSFTSFTQASDEAAISRLYGGIHYMPAIEYGVQQGREVGKLIVLRLKYKK